MIDLYGFAIETPKEITPQEAFENFTRGNFRKPNPCPHQNQNNYGADVVPTFAPPHQVPPRPGIRREVDGYAIQICLYTPTYLWLENGQQFWFYPTFVGRRSVAGYRYTYGEWMYTGFGFDIIENFTCNQ